MKQFTKVLNDERGCFDTDDLATFNLIVGFLILIGILIGIYYVFLHN